MKSAFNTINERVLMVAVDALRTEDTETLNALGLSNINQTTANEIKELKIVDLSCASEFKSPIANIRVDERMLEIFLKFATGKTRDDMMVNKAIKGGIRQSQLETLKGTSRREYDERRKRLNLAMHSKGRIEQLGEEDEILVLSEWQQLSSITDALERYVVLHDRTSISIDRAWITINQFAELD